MTAFASSAAAQMTMPTTGVLPANPITSSLLLGSDLADFQAAWATPSNALQQAWRNDVQSFANQAVSGNEPATWNAAVSESRIAQSAGLRYAMTGNIADLNKAVLALSNLAIPANNANDFITHPEVLTSYLHAYDFIRGADLADLSQSTRNTIEARLQSQAEALSNGNGTLSNARGKIGATRALTGLLVGNQALLDQGLTDLNDHFGYTTTDDGWFTDAPSSYLNYTLRHVSSFVRAYEQGTGVDLYPNIQPYIDMTLALRLPNGATPNLSNGLVVPIGINLFSQSTDPTAAANTLWYLENMGPGVSLNGTNIQNNDNSDATLFALTDFANVTPVAPSTSPTFLASGQSKIAVFRNDWSSTSDYLLLSPGVDAPAAIDFPPIVVPAFHTHNDTGEILLAARGEYLLVAGGYDRDDLSNSPPSFGPQSAEYHNVILVDGNVGPFNEGRTTRPEDFIQTNRLDSTEHGNFKGVSDFSTLKMSYASADITRSIAFPDEDYFVVADRMESETGTRTFGFNLVGRGTQTVLTDTSDLVQVKWENNGAQVIEHLVSTHAMSLSTASQWMHYNFDEFEQTTRMTADIAAENGLFVSILETGSAGSASMLSIQKLSNSSDYLAIEVMHSTDGWVDTILSQHTSVLRSAGDLSSDGTYAYMRKLNGVLDGLMLSEGTSILDLGNELVSASSALTASFHFSPDLILGTISADGLLPNTELTFHGLGNILSATLDGVALDFTNGLDEASVFLTGGGALRIELAAVPEASTLFLGGIFAIALGVRQRRLQRRRNP